MVHEPGPPSPDPAKRKGGLAQLSSVLPPPHSTGIVGLHGERGGGDDSSIRQTPSLSDLSWRRKRHVATIHWHFRRQELQGRTLQPCTLLMSARLQVRPARARPCACACVCVRRAGRACVCVCAARSRVRVQRAVCNPSPGPCPPISRSVVPSRIVVFQGNLPTTRHAGAWQPGSAPKLSTPEANPPAPHGGAGRLPQHGSGTRRAATRDAWRRMTKPYGQTARAERSTHAVANA